MEILGWRVGRILWLSAFAGVVMLLQQAHGAAVLVVVPLLAALWVQAERLWIGDV